jgi:transposase
MVNRNYKQGQNRYQQSPLPPCVDAYVNTLGFASFKFQNTVGGFGSGQPAYPPGMLVKPYLYGYINGIRSSRKLECEATRNLEAIWLAGHLRPGYKTIADFRKDNSPALKAVNKDFVLLCKQMGLLGGEGVAVDGKHKLLVAVNVTQEGNDTRQLVPMLEKAKETLQSERLKGLGGMPVTTTVNN